MAFNATKHKKNRRVGARSKGGARALARNKLLGWRVPSRIYRSFGIFFLAASGVAQRPGTPAQQGNSPAPITAAGRLQWLATSTVGPPSLIGGTISAGWGTLFNAPKEYGPHWDGFGKRYGMRFTGISVSNAMEAGLGTFWGEDPSYFRARGQPFKNRVARIVEMTFLAYESHGQTMPAYGRYIAISGNNFLSNTWRADSEATAGQALQRTLTGFLGRMASNAFAEFWPDVGQRLFKKKNP
jgi:hypothetical protein